MVHAKDASHWIILDLRCLISLFEYISLDTYAALCFARLYRRLETFCHNAQSVPYGQKTGNTYWGVIDFEYSNFPAKCGYGYFSK